MIYAPIYLPAYRRPASRLTRNFVSIIISTISTCIINHY